MIFPLLKPGGIIICDNILYKGMTANDELLPRKHFAIVKNIRDFLDFLCKKTSFVRATKEVLVDGKELESLTLCTSSRCSTS